MAGTGIAAERGQMQIEEVKSGDRVWAMDPNTGKAELRTVVQTFVHPVNTIIDKMTALENQQQGLSTMNSHRISTIHLAIAEEHEKFVSHNLKLLLAVSIPGLATLSTQEHAGHAAMTLCGAVAIYLCVAAYRVIPSEAWWRSQGQSRLFESARLTWLAKPENRILALATGLTVTAGLWLQAALDLMKMW